MAEQKFKVGDRVKITDFTGTIVGTKLVDNSIKYHVKIDQGRIYTWIFQNSLAVIHVINGILTEDDVAMLQNNNLKMLILGYKELRRGNEYLTQKYATVKYNQLWLYNNLDVLFTKFNTVSFDNLAIEQLEVKRLMSESEWEQFYMGDDGSSTFYIDMVNHQFARSSTAPMNKRYDLLTSVDNMFKIILTEKAGKKSES